MPKSKVLVLEDEPVVREVVCDFLDENGYEVLAAESCAAGERIWNAARPDAAVVDYSLPDGNAIELLSRWKTADPSIPVIILTGNGSIDLAVQAVKLGADQFLTKPADLTTLQVMLQRALENKRTKRKQVAEQTRRQRTPMNPFLGTSPAIRKLSELALKFMNAESPILLGGETGTGKGVLARWLHDHGPRGAEAFVDLNCGGLSRELLESELFGHEKGAFTGALQPKEGLLEIADHGTVFLDEIGDVELQVQSKLLKVLEEKRFRRLGDVRERSVDIRLIAATHRNLAKAIEEQAFRSDLYFRISTIPLTMPPLRERVEDIPAIADWMLRSFASDFGGPGCAMAPAALRALQSYSWPGNIRELRNILERALLLCDGTSITESHLHFQPPRHVRRTETGVRTLEQLEKDYIQEILSLEGWQVEVAAKRLGVPRSSLYQKIKRFGLTRPEAASLHS